MNPQITCDASIIIIIMKNKKPKIYYNNFNINYTQTQIIFYVCV